MQDNIFAPIFREAPIAMLGVRDGRVAMANAEAIRFLEASAADDLVGKRLEQVIPVDLRSRSSLLPALDRLAPGDIRSFERELALPGAVYAPVTIRAACLEGGMKLLCLLGNTEARDLKRSLFESEERRRGLMACVSMPVLGIDTEYRIMWAGRGAAEMAGESEHELVGRLCYRVLRSRVRPCQGCPASRASAGGGPVSGSVNTDGITVSVVAAAVRSAEGYRSGTVVLCPEETAVLESDGAGGIGEMAPDYYTAPAWRDVLLVRLDGELRVVSWLAPRKGPGRRAALALQRSVPLLQLFDADSRQAVTAAMEGMGSRGTASETGPVFLGGVAATGFLIPQGSGALALLDCSVSPSRAESRREQLGDLADRAARELEDALGQPVELSIEDEPGERSLSSVMVDQAALEAFRRIGRTPPQGFGRRGLKMRLSRLRVDGPMHGLRPGGYISLHLTNREDGDPMKPPPDGHIRSMPLEANPDGRLLMSAVSSAVLAYTVVLPEEKEGAVTDA